LWSADALLRPPLKKTRLFSAWCGVGLDAFAKLEHGFQASHGIPIPDTIIFRTTLVFGFKHAPEQIVSIIHTPIERIDPRAFIGGVVNKSRGASCGIDLAREQRYAIVFKSRLIACAIDHAGFIACRIIRVTHERVVLIGGGDEAMGNPGVEHAGLAASEEAQINPKQNGNVRLHTIGMMNRRPMDAKKV